MNVYFLTGASGAVGSAIVPLLLSEPTTRIRILIRATSEQHLRERFDELCRFWELPPGAAARQRIEALRGDAAQDDFGLQPDTYERLCADTTHIIHCAATVRMNETLEYARASALGSARQILALGRRLAASGRLQKIEFVSTVGVAGKRQGALPETWIDEPRAFHNTYEQSKAEAEVLVREAIEIEHLPITVHRPSMVVGDSKTGRIIHFQIFYFICEIMTGRKTLGIYPDFGDVRLDIIPVDWVARAIVDASQAPETAGHIYHLCSGPAHSPKLSGLKPTLRDAFRAHGQSIPPSLTIPRRLFAAIPRVAAVFAPPKLRRTLSTLPIYLDYLADNQGFDNTAYTRRLAEQGLKLPDSDSFLAVILERYLQEKYGSGRPPPR